MGGIKVETVYIALEPESRAELLAFFHGNEEAMRDFIGDYVDANIYDIILCKQELEDDE